MRSGGPGRAAVAHASSDRTPEGGCARPPLQGAGFSGSARTLGTCTGIWTLTALVETRECVAETGEFRPFQRGWSKRIYLTLVPVGGYIAPIGRVHGRAGGDGGGGASSPLEKYILHSWGCGGAGRRVESRPGCWRWRWAGRRRGWPLALAGVPVRFGGG